MQRLLVFAQREMWLAGELRTGCNVANQFSDQICPREKHGIYHNQASSMSQIFRILSIFDKNQFDRGKALLYKDKRVGVLEWWQWQARYILVMKWILYKYSASEIQIPYKYYTNTLPLKEDSRILYISKKRLTYWLYKVLIVQTFDCVNLQNM